MRTVLAAATPLAAGALLGSLAPEAQAQDKPAAAGAGREG
jgi:hypothetical protein